MASLFVLQHTRGEDAPDSDTKFIGVYSSREDADAAVARLRERPGFSAHPGGFSIDEYELDRDHWTEGFKSVDAPLPGLPEIVEALGSVPPFRELQCPSCGRASRVFALSLYFTCECGVEVKCRGFGAPGTEPQDLIEAVLSWARDRDAWEQLAHRWEELHSEPE
jgi:homoserine kinase type II